MSVQLLKDKLIEAKIKEAKDMIKEMTMIVEEIGTTENSKGDFRILTIEMVDDMKIKTGGRN